MKKYTIIGGADGVGKSSLTAIRAIEARHVVNIDIWK